MPQLSIEIVEVAERAGEEEVLADIAEWPFDLPLCFRPIRPTSAGLEALVPGQADQGTIVDHQAVGILADHSTILEMNVESYRCREALDRKRGRGRPPAHATIKKTESTEVD